MRAIAVYLGITSFSVVGTMVTVHLIRPKMHASLAVKRLVWIGVALFLVEAQVIAVAAASAT